MMSLIFNFLSRKKNSDLASVRGIVALDLIGLKIYGQTQAFVAASYDCSNVTPHILSNSKEVKRNFPTHKDKNSVFLKVKKLKLLADRIFSLPAEFFFWAGPNAEHYLE
jgi:hypothetical protein